MTRTRDLRGEDVFDSRDAEARLNELESDRESATVEDGQEYEYTAEDGTHFTDDWDESQEEEYQALVALRNDYCGGEGWHDGAGFIKDSYFEDYARQLAEDIGALQNCDHWPATCIDWEQAACELQMDYSSCEFAGETYWYRS